MLLGDIGLPLINNDYSDFLKEFFLVLGNHEFYTIIGCTLWTKVVLQVQEMNMYCNDYF